MRQVYALLWCKTLNYGVGMATGSLSAGTDKSIGLRRRKDRDRVREEEGEIARWRQSKKGRRACI